jgi:hypothetical protein
MGISMALRARRLLLLAAALAPVALALASAPRPARAGDVYRCPAPEGGWHFTNVPTRGGCQTVIKVREEPKPQPPVAAVERAAARIGRATGLMRYQGLIDEAARTHRLEPALIKAVMHTESNFDPRATSKKGALGLMQLMPTTARSYGIADVFDPAANINGGAKHLRALLDRYGERNLELVLAAYNAGEEAVERHGRQVPPYAETQGYVRAVLRLLEGYRANRPAPGDASLTAAAAAGR